MNNFQRLFCDFFLFFCWKFRGNLVFRMSVTGFFSFTQTEPFPALAFHTVPSLCTVTSGRLLSAKWMSLAHVAFLLLFLLGTASTSSVVLLFVLTFVPLPLLTLSVPWSNYRIAKVKKLSFYLFERAVASLSGLS